MKLIAGLGNPGKRYTQTRHNVGFMTVAELARRWGLAESRYDKRFQAEVAEAQRGGQRVLLAQPQTYMNLSGQSVLAIAQFYKLERADILIVYDDVDLELGRVRVRATGSGGGQKGMNDVLLRLGNQDVARVRIGVGRPSRGTTSDYVLETFFPHEHDTVADAIATAAEACETWLASGIDAAMNRCNTSRQGKNQARGAAESEGGSS